MTEVSFVPQIGSPFPSEDIAKYIDEIAALKDIIVNQNREIIELKKVIEESGRNDADDTDEADAEVEDNDDVIEYVSRPISGSATIQCFAKYDPLKVYEMYEIEIPRNMRAIKELFLSERCKKFVDSCRFEFILPTSRRSNIIRCTYSLAFYKNGNEKLDFIPICYSNGDSEPRYYIDMDTEIKRFLDGNATQLFSFNYLVDTELKNLFLNSDKIIDDWHLPKKHERQPKIVIYDETTNHRYIVKNKFTVIWFFELENYSLSERNKSIGDLGYHAFTNVREF